ncbi:MFS transporter [Actinomadura sp. 9N215]|uniref:MFS transporter n=1 Tax=Actinomadura sp. 9N215 TaxID=3375150 RepID=UPI0037BB9BF3
MTLAAATTREPRSEARWRRDFGLLWAGSSISQLGSVAAAVSYPLLCLAQFESPMRAGWVAFAATFPKLFMQLPAGVLVDRCDRRTVMLVCQAVRCSALAVLAAFLLTGDVRFWVLVVVAGVDGLFGVLHNVAEYAAVPQIVPDRHLDEAVSRMEVRVHAANMLGRPLGGLLFGIDRMLPFAGDALSSLVSLTAVGLMKTNRLVPEGGTPAEPEERGMLADFSEGIGWFLREPFLRLAVLVSSIFNILGQVVLLMMISIAVDGRSSSLSIGIMVTSSGVGGVVGSYAAPRLLKSMSPIGIYLAAAWSWVGVGIAMALFQRPPVFLLGWGVIGLTGALTSVVAGIYLNRVTPSRLLGRVTSVGLFLVFGGVPFGGLLGGYLISTFGAARSATMVVAAMAVVAILVTAGWWGSALRTEKAPANSC